jgi:hypothetical protein
MSENIRNSRDIRAMRAVRKLVGQEAYNAARLTTEGQNALDSLAVAIMRVFEGRGSKNDVGCFAETVISYKDRSGDIDRSLSQAKLRTGSKTPGSPR